MFLKSFSRIKKCIICENEASLLGDLLKDIKRLCEENVLKNLYNYQNFEKENYRYLSKWEILDCTII